MKKRSLTPKGYLILAAILLIFIAVLVLEFLGPRSTILNFLVRLFALWGFTSLAIAIILTPFLKEVLLTFGKPFIKVHHYFAFAGLTLISLHPIFSAIESMTLTVFLPVFDSWRGFWVYAGRLAFYIIYLALVAVLFRRKIKPWRAIHALMYLVLLMGFIHGILIGTDFANIGILVIFSILFAFSVATLVLKRYKQYSSKK
ncbi:MAG: hypothetical protein U5N58_12580 [Actinomycetota bacterium]|nr:hypothetical protein [Actinomycetota bacterium]